MPAISTALGATLGWVLAVAAVAAGYAAYGWPGVALAVSVVVFWLLLQFSQALRLMRTAAARPVGSLRASALMLHSKLHQGQRLAELMKLTGSFGLRADTSNALVENDKNNASPNAAGAGNDVETYAWTDDGGDAVHVLLRAGRVESWALVRAEPAPTAAPIVAEGSVPVAARKAAPPQA